VSECSYDIAKCSDIALVYTKDAITKWQCNQSFPSLNAWGQHLKIQRNYYDYPVHVTSSDKQLPIVNSYVCALSRHHCHRCQDRIRPDTVFSVHVLTCNIPQQCPQWSAAHLTTGTHLSKQR